LLLSVNVDHLDDEDVLPDLRSILAVQGLRAGGYGFGSVLLGTALAAGGLSATRVGAVFAAMLAGMAGSSLLVGRYADRLGRRRGYLALLVVMAVAAAVFALTDRFPLLLLAALVATRLSGAVEPSAGRGRPGRLVRSRGTVRRLAALFAVDAFAGGFVVQALLVVWFAHRYGAAPELMGVVFFAAGLLQAASSVAAGRLGGRIGLPNTMVFTHLPANLLLAAIPFAPTLPVAVALLLARSALSQMDVPARQAYVVAMVEPGERTAAAAHTNTARYAARPVAPLAAVALTQLPWIGLPFVVAGGLRIAYDLALFTLLRHARPAPPGPGGSRGGCGGR
jgi:MFS family permease